MTLEMKKKLLLILTIFCLYCHSFSLDKNVITDWNNTGSSFNISVNTKKISITDFGAKPDDATDNSIALQNAIKSLNGTPGIIEIPSGNFLFKKTISIPSNILLKGKGSDKLIIQRKNGSKLAK